MPSPKPVTAIFDIGKTNKKFLLFDENYAVVEKHQTELEQTIDDDGDPCENLEKLETWIRDQIKRADKNYSIGTLNFSAYGASLVHLDKNGKPVAPLYNYLKDYPEDLLSGFYESVGGKKEFSLQTASPPMGMLNSGLQLYWLKHQKPNLFQQVETSLHFPNYLSYLFTRKKYSELTSIGCHTGLWNFKNMKYHKWLEENGLQKLLPEVKDISITAKAATIGRVGLGIHDSSAALAPYLIGLDEPFMLVSTGTWSITLNPFNSEPLTFEELERDCLCYLDIFGRQVKSSRLFLGAEYAHQKKKIERYFDTSVNDNESGLDISLIDDLIQKEHPELKIQLELAHHSGPFPKEKPGNWQVHNFSSAKEAHHQLILDLAAIQAESIKLAEGSKKIKKLVVTGGFSQNSLFISLLASFFQEKEIYTSSLPDASALGAAMVMNEGSVISNLDAEAAAKARHDLKKLLGLNLIEPIKGLKISHYSWSS